MRKLLKRTVLLISILLVFPGFVLTRLDWLLGDDAMFVFMSQALSTMPGLPGNYLRLAYYVLTLKRIGKDVLISIGSVFSKPSAEVGNHVNIGAYCVIGDVRLGDHVLIASRVSLMSGKYQHGSALVSAPASGESRISIGSRTWVGEGAIVASDVGSDCIVGAGSVVMRNVPDGYMAAGNPAKVIRMDRGAAAAQAPDETTVTPS